MTLISDIDYSSYTKAQKLINKLNNNVLDYVLRIMSGEEFEYNLKSKLVVEDDQDKATLNKYIKGYQAIYSECSKRRGTDVKAFISHPGNEWLQEIPSAVCAAASAYGFKRNDNKPNSFAFSMTQINQDGKVRIPKLASFRTERKLVMPNGMIPSMAHVTRNEDGTYTIFVTTKKARK